MSVSDNLRVVGRTLSLERMYLLLGRPFRWLANLSFLGLIGTFVAAYMQYNSWRDEKNITRYREELSSATAVFSEIAAPLSSMINLQEILFYTYKNALGHYGNIDARTRSYLARNAQKAYDDYVNTRTTLRKSVDVLAGKAELFIDRPIQPDYARAKIFAEQPFMASERDLLRNAGFKCNEHMPDPGRSVLPLLGMSVDWNSVKHHVATNYYCLDDLHTLLLPIRIWAEEAGKSQDEEDKTEIPRENTIKNGFVLQVRRLNDFISVASAHIETIRLRDRTKGFLKHQFCGSCDP